MPEYILFSLTRKLFVAPERKSEIICAFVGFSFMSTTALVIKCTYSMFNGWIIDHLNFILPFHLITTSETEAELKRIIWHSYGKMES